MYRMFLVTDESQTGTFISAIVAAVGPRSAKGLVIDELGLGSYLDLKAEEIEMNPLTHGVKYLVRKKI